MKEVEINGVTMAYVEQGTGEPIVFVHGAVSDLRAWEPIRPQVADRHRFIAPTLRYFGKGAWPDKGERFSESAHAEDIIAFIDGLGVGPVDLVGWSYGANVAATAAVESPGSVRTLILFEPALDQFIADGEAGAAAREAADRMFGPVTPAIEAGDEEQAVRLLVEGVFQMQVGGFDRQSPELQAMQLSNARTMPLLWNAPPSTVTCVALNAFERPTLIVYGAESNRYWSHVAEGMDACLPNAEVATLPAVNHDGPVRDPAGFAAMIEDFVTRH
jgi:pimeloyl-ACP methyl ester carboxylesterase